MSDWSGHVSQTSVSLTYIAFPVQHTITFETYSYVTCVTAQFNLVFVQIQYIHQKNMPIPGFKPKHLSLKSTGIVPLYSWLYVNTDNDLRSTQYQKFAAGLPNHTPQKINEG